MTNRPILTLKKKKDPRWEMPISTNGTQRRTAKNKGEAIRLLRHSLKRIKTATGETQQFYKSLIEHLKFRFNLTEQDTLKEIDLVFLDVIKDDK